MVEALDYYGSDKARYDLQNKEVSIKMTQIQNSMERNRSVNDYNPAEYINERRTMV